MELTNKKPGLFLLLRSLLLCFICIFFSQASSPKPPLTAFYITGFAQGTTYNITYFASDSLITKQETDSLFVAIDSSLSIYKPYSLINRFNNSARGIVPEQHLRRVISKSLKIYHETGGLFDITVYPLGQIWGFGLVKSAASPTPALIRETLKSVGSDKIKLTSDSLLKTLPSIKIDVNGIAQGYTVDLLADLLKSKGITNFMVEVGGEIRAEGRKPDDSPFLIGIESPAKAAYDEQVMQKIIRLEKGGITTSGHYRNYRSNGNKTISHLLDPRTGSPVQTELISVTVWAPDAMTADGYDNALMGLHLPEALALVNKLPDVEAYFIYRNATGEVADTATTGFAELFICK